ncbi:MAG: HlyD family efflux transporter periplasmic adaptor subunit [Oscillospiraceae bacterium]|nr:HlyD family efflux transporter periplasmic adaptor subunit [Oscillospiraceae bacterium]
MSNLPTQDLPAAPADLPGLPEAATVPPPPRRTAAQKKRRGRIVKTIVGWAVALAVVGGIVYGLNWLFTRKTPVSYATETVYTGMLETAVQGWGSIRPVESVDIAVKNRGTVEETFFNAGDMVAEGDLLFTMGAGDIDEAIAEIDKKIAKAQEELAAIQGDEADRQANLVVKAPFKGQLVEAAPLGVGDQVTTGQKVGLLVDDANLKLTLYFSYAYENLIKTGMAADISIPATMAVVSGQVDSVRKVRRVSPEGTTLFEVTLALPNPGALTAGMAATAVLRADGEAITPYEAGVLVFARSETLYIKAPGKLVAANVLDYMDYRAGDILCRIEYKEDNTEVEALNQQIAQFEADKALKRLDYDDLRVTAPLSGTVMYNNLIPGATAEPGLAVISIANLDKMIVEAQVDERDVSRVRPGMPVEISVWLGEGQQMLTGTVKSVSMSAGGDNGGGVSYFPAVFEIENYSGMLMSGMGVDYRLIVEQKFDILVAPVIAVKNTEQGTCVFVKSEERPDTAIDLEPGVVPSGFWAVSVVCGIGNENGIEILSGVSDGTEVFTQIIPLDENQGGGGIMGGEVVVYG